MARVVRLEASQYQFNLAASNTLLQGKILRGGMGAGMLAWGAIFSAEELQALLDYLWTFQC